MVDDIRELPARSHGLSRFLGGNPIAVAFRLIALSVLVGFVLAALGLDPLNILESVRRLVNYLWNISWDAVRGVWRYFLLGAVIVVPLWFLSRLFSNPNHH